MAIFIAQTGHAKDLSKAELLALLGEVLIDEVPDGWVIETEIEDAVDFLNHCGGLVRLLEVVKKGPSHVPLNIMEWMEDVLTKQFHGVEGKKRFGLSIHPKSEKILTKTLINLKKNLAKQLGNLRFVNKNYENISSVSAWHENLLSKTGAEFHLFRGQTQWYLGKTLAIQDFEAYSHRDYNRPARDVKNGMFPPKLAQILINLTGQPGATIYDPFCGGGTVLQEAWLQGRNAQGSDLSEKQIEDAEKNLTWLKQTWHLAEEIPALAVKDACEITAEDLPQEEFCIVTETWLGPALFKPLTSSERPVVEEQVEDLYHAFFKNLAKIVQKPTTVVFTAPYFRDGKDRYFIRALPQLLAQFGTIIPLSDSERPTLLFERNDQFTSREIWKIQIQPQKS